MLIGAGLVVLNFVVRLMPDSQAMEWLARTDLLLHAGVVLGLIGILVGDAL
ncbi:MAG: hypothetical protein GX620_13750 [Chloroflexi bacterium]|nr:hypothetical protein [Chloroflexota bacterium]